MNHFSDGSWIDFVNGVLLPPQESELQSHLDRACEECLNDFAAWILVHESLSRTEYQPPEHLLLSVERLFAPAKPWRWLNEVARWAELTFDTFQQRSPVFVRGVQPGDRHLVYEAEPFVIDVTVKTETDLSDVLIAGQILNTTASDQAANEAYVLVLTGNELVARAVANENGEFELRCERQDELNLFISIRGERAIGLSLNDSSTVETVSQ